jgi:outer membrane protein with beta-barrel domain/centrosomal CEP192-like protein
VNATTLKSDLVGRFISLAMYFLLVTGYAAPASAQFKLQQTFENTTAPGWTLSNSALLTAPSIDAAGSGWLRLTAAVGSEKGLALNDTFSFTSNQPVVVEFDYVSWGGTGADGMTLFLYDPTVTSPMSSAAVGGGLGYCGGAGGYLAIGLDEYGNFSNPGDRCGAASFGPGFKPESLVIRGPESANNVWVTRTAVPGGIDNPHVATRPSPKTVLLTLTPAVSPAIGYTITVQFQSASGQPFQTLFSNVAFPYAPPAILAVGFSASTGGSTNNHELHGVVTATPDDLQVTMNGPSSAVQGASLTYNVTLTNNGNYPIGAADAPTVVDIAPAAVTGATWTCVGSGGATCDASGTGSINTSNVTLPVNASVTYSITGTLDPAATCGSTVANTANADFGSGSSFLDPDETNNSATVDSTVVCNVTLAANPASLNFAPQAVNVASNSQTVTLTEGINSASISSISVTGDYAQTNNCPASLTASQTCTINVVFTPTNEGSRNGTLTILSNATSSPMIATQVSLSGTGTNATPSPFSFTSLNNVDLSSEQVSNAITVANTNVPSLISVSSGAQYSINGGPFTSVAGVVSPGAQVQVQVTAAANFSTAVSAVLTIGGIDSAFNVTTGTQPVLQGGFTPLTGTAPSSVQVSNPIEVIGTTIPAAITVGSGALYSINGGPFTSAPGVVQPGDQVRLQVTTSSAYNTTSSSIVTIGGVNSTFTVTTAAQPVLQGGFTAVSNAAPLSVQVSNPITVTGTTIAVPITVSSGAEYSINGGPFTSAPGVVEPGDQVKVEAAASTDYSTAASALVTIGGVKSTFTVTTAAQPVLQGGFTAVGSAAPSSVQVSNPITVTGTTIAVPITISSGAEYSIDGGAFTSAPGVVKPGDLVRVQLTASSAYATTASALLNIGGIETKFSVSTGPQLQNVVVTGGAGAIDTATVLVLALLALLRVPGLRRSMLVTPVTVVVLCSLLGAPARAADDGGWVSNVYGGLRLGGSSSSMTASRLTADLQADGYDVSAADAERSSVSGTLYVGYELPRNFGVELGWSYLGRTRAVLEGLVPPDLNQLLADAAHIVRGSGDIVSLEARYRWELAPRIAVDLRAGPYVWITKTEVWIGGVDALSRTDDGLGYTLGVGPRYALGKHLGFGISADYFSSTSENHFVQVSATAEYHF